VGSRQPILFTEGTKGSFDYQLFTLLFPDYLIKPLGSCTQVIQTVKAIKNIQQLNGLQIFGIIDRDRRPDHEISALEVDNVYTLKVAEIENMFIVPEVIKEVCQHLESDKTVEQIQDKLFIQLSSELSTQVMDRVRSEAAFFLQTLNLRPAKQIAQLSEILNTVNTFKIQKQYDDIENIFNEIIATKDIQKLLAFYNRKSLLQAVARELGVQEEIYIKQVLRALKVKELRQIYLTTYIPDFNNETRSLA